MRVLALISLGVVAFAVWLATCTTHIVWDGSYIATVRIVSEAEPPAAVVCQAAFPREAQIYLNAPWQTHLAETSVLGHAHADPFSGEPLTLHVRISGREAMSGLELSRSEPPYLVVVARWPDGRRAGKIIDLPAQREAGDVALTVRFP